PDAFSQIPKEGPLVVIANHPFGVLDGLTICHLASRMRANFQILTNSVLCQDPALDPYLLPVSFDETREAMHMNINTKQEALKTLNSGGAVVIFPGGGISTAVSWRGEVTDLEWKRFAAKLIQLSRATVIPIYFHGQNSRLFQFVSQFSLTLRLSLLLYEVNRMMGTTLQLEIGDPLPFAKLAPIKDRQALLDYLREHVYGLAKRP
ncbi:MAG: lysophospholipid acyltransferase family protein, partial [Bacteroidota bacterium]